MLTIGKDTITLLKAVSLPYTYFIESAMFSGDATRILAYSLLNSTLQLWEINYSLEDLDQPIRATSKNIKAHFGNVVHACFFRAHYAISSSHDQNIKVWDLRKCVDRKPPKAKKNKKKKNPKKGPKSMEEEDNSGSEFE